MIYIVRFLKETYVGQILALHILGTVHLKLHVGLAPCNVYAPMRMLRMTVV